MNALAYVLVIIGALNWGLVGAANLDLVQLLLGWSPIVVKIVYVVVGLAALWLLVAKSKGKKADKAPEPEMPSESPMGGQM